MKTFDSIARQSRRSTTKRPSEIPRSHPQVKLLTAPGSDDPRWQLVQRVVASRSLGRSTLLSNFLLFVCDRYLQGRVADITEQQIGMHVFGRLEDFKSGDDNIVRNYARTLRKRMEEYFATEGRHETSILTIPRGAYLPVFATKDTETPAFTPAMVPAISAEAAVHGIDPLAHPAAIDDALLQAGPQTNILPSDALTSDKGYTSQPEQPSGRHLTYFPLPHRTRQLLNGLAALCLIAIGVLVGCFATRLRPDSWFHRETPTAKLNHLFWSKLFEDKRDTFLVPSDGGLVMLHSFTRQHVSLPDYASGNYGSHAEIADGIAELSKPAKAEDSAKLEHKVSVIAARRYTSIVDLDLVSRLSRLPEVLPDRLMIRYARDLRIDDLRTGNVILLGSADANPWVDLFQKQLNFQFSPGIPFGGSAVIINQHPLPHEQSTYASGEPNDPVRHTYGVIAYVPNLDGTGHVLLIEGINMAGTQAAGSFLLSPTAMQSVLEHASSPSGAIRPFEILIETGNIAANASSPRVLSERIGLPLQ
jgi:hypothetical protein